MIHRNKMKEDLGPFQKKMEDMFVKRKEQVEERYGKKVRTIDQRLKSAEGTRCGNLAEM